ncbi:rhodanese-like domain-containing protein [Allokutzneria albata]|uniref:Rhodanese-related sulfurtransferase n=1 Tax=Allokutzneria albata TaxID=211114 RepID=A0A1H0A421_ALLAB|nr:rhodanese-like domain-containing protein [Allokutzneria albata]SDN28409.1 Rhodanese-related sulfurtransferase [Allokutzneria albata]
MQVPTVDVTDLGADVKLLDVREQDEWNAGHAPGALHIPLGELAERLAELPEDGELHVVCRMGGRSARAVAFLNQNGWDAINVAGGMQSWQAAGKPLVAADAGAEPEVI